MITRSYCKLKGLSSEPKKFQNFIDPGVSRAQKRAIFDENWPKFFFLAIKSLSVDYAQINMSKMALHALVGRCGPSSSGAMAV